MTSLKRFAELVLGALVLLPVCADALTIDSVTAFNRVTSSEATISWITDVAADSMVEYGPTRALGLRTARDPAKTLNHVVRLTSLAPGTTYYFRTVSQEGGATATSAILSFSTARDDTALIYPEHFVYRGAFRFPGDLPDQASRWSYGGYAITYNPQGDWKGPLDGYPGSLFGVGHDHHELVAEISIPAPSLTREVAALPAATQLQPFSDVTGGLRASSIPETADIRGLQYLEPQAGQSTPKLYWTVQAYYNASAQDYLSHGWSELNLANPEAKGVWHLGPRNSTQQWHSMKTSGYIFDVPREFADIHLGGRYLVSGRKHGTGAFGGSSGPTLYAFAPWKGSSGAPRPSADLDALPLLWYPLSDTGAYGFKVCDTAEGGAWIDDTRNGVLVVGRRGVGPVFYGEPRPGDVESGKGWHCDPYEPQMLLYDPAELLKVARGEQQPWEVLPYARFVPSAQMPNCQVCRITGATYDRKRRLLYLVQLAGDTSGEYRPLVHVFQIDFGPSQGYPPRPTPGTSGSSGNTSSGQRPPEPPDRPQPTSSIASRESVDLNGDGRGDTLQYRSSSGEWTMSLSAADGADQAITGTWAPGWSVSAAAFDGDHLADLFMYNDVSGEWLQGLNTGDGRFRYAGGVWSPGWKTWIVDLNSDRRSDIFLYNAITGVWFKCTTVDPAAPDFHYERGIWDPRWDVHPADFDADGRTDFFLYNAASGLWIRATTGTDGGFGYAGGSWSRDWHVNVADFNGDRRSDVFLYSSQSGAWYLVETKTDGLDYTTGLWQAGAAIHAADLTGDGRADLFLHDEQTGAWVQAISTAAGFTYVSGSWTPGLRVQTAGDFDGNGLNDLFLSTPISGQSYRMLNRGGGTFHQRENDGTFVGCTAIVSRQVVP